MEYAQLVMPQNERRDTVKKFVALSLALILTLVMCVPAFARAEICADCGTRLSTRVKTEMEAVPCAVVHGEWDLWTYKYQVEYCPTCGESWAETLISQKFECGHTAE